jgi:MFS family permease
LPSTKETPVERPTVIEHGRRGMFNALGIRNFRIFWLGINTLFFAGQLQMPAQAWLAYELTHSALELTLVAAMQSVPMVVLSPFSGVIIDRVQKRDIILITQIFTVAIAAAIAVLIATGHIQYWLEFNSGQS